MKKLAPELRVVIERLLYGAVITTLVLISRG